MNVEAKVRELDALRAEARQYEGFLRQLRLGRGVEMIRFRFRAGVYGYGWANAKAPEPMPAGMEHEFYDFLARKASKKAEEIRAVERVLGSVTHSDEPS